MKKIKIDLDKLSEEAREEVERLLEAKKAPRKTLMLTARVTPRIMEAISEFQRKYDMEFRNEAVIEIVKVACNAVGIDISKIPEPRINVESEAEEAEKKEEEEPSMWMCSHEKLIGRKEKTIDDCRECANGLIPTSKWFEKCEDLPQHAREEILKGVAVEKPEREEKPEEAISTVATKTKEETTQKDQVIWCPDKDDWIHKVKCATCQTVDFKKYHNCQEKRLKNPNDPIFKPTKPKPLNLFT